MYIYICLYNYNEKNRSNYSFLLTVIIIMPLNMDLIGLTNL